MGACVVMVAKIKEEVELEGGEGTLTEACKLENEEHFWNVLDQYNGSNFNTGIMLSKESTTHTHTHPPS